MTGDPAHIRSFKTALDGNYVLILTSSSVEKGAVRQVLGKARPVAAGRETTGCGIGLLDDRMVLHVSGRGGASDTQSVGRIVSDILADPTSPRPCLIVLTGYCWGNPAKVHTGDVIISTEVVSLNRTKAEASGTVPVPTRHVSPVSVDEFLLQAVGERLCSDGITISTGVLASLETLYKSGTARDQLIGQYPDLLGGEMEAFHFLPGCSDIPWVVVKAVSDDGGDSVTRNAQPNAAAQAASVLRPLVSLLQDEELIPRARTSPEVESLRDTLIGDSILVDAQTLRAESLNDYLNDTIGPLLDSKLRRYGSEIEFGPRFPVMLCDLILEVMQNALRHGRAAKAEVMFNDAAVTLLDDGRPFELGSISGERGGAMAWQKFKNEFLDSGDVEIRPEVAKKPYRNKYTFRLIKHHKMLRHAMERCAAAIIEGRIGAPMGPGEVLQVRDDCEVVYFDAKNLRMSSRRLEIASAVRAMVQEGRRVFVGCSSLEDVFFFKGRFEGINADMVTVFVEPPR